MRPIVGKGLLAQLVEHLPFKEVVLGSSPRQVTNKFPSSSWPRTPPFHGENTGSNPVGNATLATPALSTLPFFYKNKVFFLFFETLCFIVILN